MKIYYGLKFLELDHRYFMFARMPSLGSIVYTKHLSNESNGRYRFYLVYFKS